MMSLPAQEWIPLLGMVLLSLLGVAFSHTRLLTGREIYARAAAPLVTLSVCLEGVILMSRGPGPRDPGGLWLGLVGHRGRDLVLAHDARVFLR